MIMHKNYNLTYLQGAFLNVISSVGSSVKIK
jgi:hypothetical protein